jgi:hypothetical protein
MKMAIIAHAPREIRTRNTFKNISIVFFILTSAILLFPRHLSSWICRCNQHNKLNAE